jgi:hypothetical protein
MAPEKNKPILEMRFKQTVHKYIGAYLGKLERGR